MDRVVTSYKGMKFSLQPHGWRSRLFSAFVFFVVSFGGALAVVSPAEAAAGFSYVTVCGNDVTWYVNGDEDGSDPDQGDRRPKATGDGLVFGPRDLIHHVIPTPSAVLEVTSDLKPGTFVASPAPDIPDFFSMEVMNDNGSGYGTLRWNSESKKWSAKNGTVTGTDPAKVLTDAGLSLVARTFGVGYTNSPPGSVTSLVSSISFLGTTYKLSCPITTSPSPSPVVTVVPGPGATKTVIKTVTVYVTVSTHPSKSPKPTPTPSESEEVLIPVTPSPSESPTLATNPISNDSDGAPLWPWGVGVVGVAGLALAILGLRGRRRSDTGKHHVGNTGEQETYSVDDYQPYDETAQYGQDLGGAPGSSYYNNQTQQFPAVRDNVPPHYDR